MIQLNVASNCSSTNLSLDTAKICNREMQHLVVASFVNESVRSSLLSQL